MKRILAAAFTAGVLGLFLGGCSAKQQQPPQAPPAATAGSGATTGSGSTGSTGSNSSDDVDSLLKSVDKQLNDDDQPAADQD